MISTSFTAVRHISDVTLSNMNRFYSGLPSAIKDLILELSPVLMNLPLPSLHERRNDVKSLSSYKNVNEFSAVVTDFESILISIYDTGKTWRLYFHLH